jgi:hypothetical protein
MRLDYIGKKRQRGFVGPMKVLKQVHAGPGSSRAGRRLCQALEKIAALLHSRQFQRFRKIGKNSPKTWCDLSQFGRVGPICRR